ncbi:MAG: MarR family transcriptional regulator, partial [Actinomycetota bacterium]
VRSERRTTPKTALAGEAWRELFDFFIGSRKERDPVIAKHQLTANDAKGLWSLSLTEGKTMGALAAEWTCDASNATWIVDRLEKRGLAERRAAAGDRRVKMVVLTPLGQKTRDAIMASFYEPPEALLALSRDELESLRRIAVRLTDLSRETTARAAASERPA